MRSPRYSELGRSLGLLDDELPWYWTLAVYGSPWLLMAGFVTFPLAMDNRNVDMSANNSAITVASSIVLGTSYIVCAMCCIRWRKSHVLQDLLLIPFFGSSLVGLLNVALSVGLRTLYPLDTRSIAVISIASASTVGFGSAALYNSQIEKYIPGFMSNKRRFTSGGIDDAELQRRQLLRLYLKKDNDRTASTDASRSTFRIDIPDGDGVDEEEMGITLPESAYERQRAAPPSNYKPFTTYEPSPGSALVPSQDSSRSSNHRNSGGSYKPTAVRFLYPQRTARDARRPVAELGDL